LYGTYCFKNKNKMAENRFEELQAYIAVVENLSFTSAAEKMGVAKSSLSRRVSQLERRLGVQLLQRTTRRLSLTDEGEQFFQSALKILNELDEVEQSISGERLEPRGRIRVAAPMSFSQAQLSEVVGRFALEYPEISLEFDLSDRQVDLIDDGFDLAIRIGDLPDSSLKARRLGVIRFATAASPGYLAKRGEPRQPSDLKQHDGLFYTNLSSMGNWRFLIDGMVKSVVPRQVLASNNGDFLARSAATGLGLVAAPTFILYSLIERGELEPVLADFAPPETGIYAVFPPGRLVPMRVRLLVDFVQQCFGDHPYWDKFD
jgi:DNA-binding transcriptional LysR family regulator